MPGRIVSSCIFSAQTDTPFSVKIAHLLSTDRLVRPGQITYCNLDIRVGDAVHGRKTRKRSDESRPAIDETFSLLLSPPCYRKRDSTPIVHRNQHECQAGVGRMRALAHARADSTHEQCL